MAEEQPDLAAEARPKSRRGKAKARPESGRDEPEGGSSWRTDVDIPEASTARLEQQQHIKERKKPRKLEVRSVVIEEPVITLDTRVDRLERQFQALSSRVDNVEVRQVRRTTASSSYRRSSSASTRATSGPRHRPRPKSSLTTTTTSNANGPSLADQLRESHRLRKTSRRHQRQPPTADDTIEEVPRSALTTTTTNSATRQVALTGQYNIPLPASLTAQDIQNLRSGLTAAGSIARSLAGVLTARGDGSGTATPTPRGGGAAAAAVNTTAAGPDDQSAGSGGGVDGGGNATSSPPAGNRQPEGTSTHHTPTNTSPCSFAFPECAQLTHL